ncbi:serine protease [Streptomyces sp. NPDC002589]|uniref:S1 family peptidase n=1 Tax=Streptomyces sp. NPDC002589 TaxID=3154420 RepID=UPI0033244951
MTALSDVVDVIRPAIVQIAAIEHGTPRRAALGTGFIVSDRGLVLTASHVVAAMAQVAAQGWNNPALMIGLAHTNEEMLRGNFTLMDAQVVADDPGRDLALLQMQPNPFGTAAIPSGIVINGKQAELTTGVAEISSDRPRDGAPIAVSGYPLQESTLITTCGIIASAWATELIPALGSQAAFPEMPRQTDVYVVDVTVNRGNSGGPVYLSESGRVIGVCRAFRSAQVFAGDQPAQINGQALATNSGLSLVVPIRYGEEMLTEYLGRMP